jgi:hypothetical protein
VQARPGTPASPGRYLSTRISLEKATNVKSQRPRRRGLALLLALRPDILGLLMDSSGFRQPGDRFHFQLHLSVTVSQVAARGGLLSL